MSWVSWSKSLFVEILFVACKLYICVSVKKCRFQSNRQVVIISSTNVICLFVCCPKSQVSASFSSSCPFPDPLVSQAEFHCHESGLSVSLGVSQSVDSSLGVKMSFVCGSHFRSFLRTCHMPPASLIPILGISRTRHRPTFLAASHFPGTRTTSRCWSHENLPLTCLPSDSTRFGASCPC